MTTLHLSPDLTLPLDTVTSTLVVYGGKGMGKTNLGSVLMEELAAHRLKFSVIDPMGVWWGLRHDKTGTGKGIEVLILGGVHADIPIEPTSGAVVADLVVDESVNVVIDISRRPDGSMWSIGERVRFVTDYCKRLYQRQGERRRPLMQVIEEAARFIPQMIRKGEEQVAACMGAIAVLVEEGRNVAIGVALITQRSARLNKDVAELADCMIAFRTVGPNSRRAVLDWLGEHVEKERLKELDVAVRSLPVGSALVVSPGWLQVETIVKFRARQTFDSSKTPKPGEQEARVSGTGAKPDLGKYQERMAATIEKAKADDPKELRRRITQLEADNRKLKTVTPPKVTTPAPVKEKRVEIPVLQDGQLKRLESLSGQAETIIGKLSDVLRQVRGDLGKIHSYYQQQKAKIFKSQAHNFTKPGQSDRKLESYAQPRPVPSPVQMSGNPDAQLGKGERTILIAVAQYPDGVTREQLTVLTGYKRSSRDAYIQRLRNRGFADLAGKSVIITEPGIERLGPDVKPLPTGDALQAYWLERLPEGERKIFKVLIEHYPATIAREELAEVTGYKRSSRDAYLQRLKARQLVRIDSRMVRASEELFA